MSHGERTRLACLTSAIDEAFPRVSRPVDVTDAAQFPGMAELSRHYASMSPERRAELEGDW